MKNKISDERRFNYFRVDNELIDNQAKIIGWQGLLVFTALCRYVDSDGKCFPSINTLSEKIGINRKTVIKGIEELIKRNMVSVEKTVRENGGYSNNLYTLKDYSKWLKDDIPQSLRRTTPSVREGLPLVPEKDSKKTNNNNTNNKVIAKTSFADTEANNKDIKGKELSKEIQEVLNIFYEINPTLNFGNKTQRKAVEDLINKFGYEKTINTVKFSNSIQGKQYTPTITTPLELKNNLAKLMIYYKREQEPKKGIVPNFKF